MRRAFLVAVLASGLFGLFVGVGGAATLDQRVLRCGNVGPVAAVFDLTESRQIWQRLPALLKSPELDTSLPASVVVYGGQVSIPVFGVTGADLADVDGAICVLMADGEQYFYGDVSRAGFTSP